MAKVESTAMAKVGLMGIATTMVRCDCDGGDGNGARLCRCDGCSVAIAYFADSVN